MMHNENHERYLREAILANSLSSKWTSEKTYNKPLKKSSTFFEAYKENLLDKYEGKTLLDIEGANHCENSSGETIKITIKEKIDFTLENISFNKKIRENLKLLEGVGPATEKKLKQQGFTTIDSLKNHDSYGDKANKLVSKLDNCCTCDLFNLLNKNKYSNECKNNILRCASLINTENFKFMDIETLGLSNVPIILIGVAEIKGDSIISTQYLLKNIMEEEAVLEGYLSHLNDESVHVTFNGASFDVPFIRNRCNYYGIEHNLNLAHMDLLIFARNLWKDILPNCQLQTIEEHFFNLKRVGDVPGQYIPEYYETYLATNNIGPLVPIVEHNRQDIISLASFLKKMYGEVTDGII